MRLTAHLVFLLSCLVLTACAHKGSNPDDPLESMNRKIFKFNMAFDATMLKPPAKLYLAVVPPKIRLGINNAFNNVQMLPSVANDLLQADWRFAIKDSWRFFINSTLGVAGLIDVASHCGLPPHYNDMGLTFAKWGKKKSAYLVIPFIGPSTVRDGLGMLVDYAAFTPYPYLINDDGLLWGLAALRYIDLRAQFLETERIMSEALDKYSFVRDAYLQNRNYRITGEQQPGENDDYVEESESSDYIDDDEPPITAQNHVTRRRLSA